MRHEAARKLAGRVAVWLGVAVAVVALYQRAAGVPEPMQREELARVGRQLSSDALEASLLARALASGQVTTHFAVTQHEQIAQDLDDVRKKLEHPPPVGHEEAAQQMRESAQRLGEILMDVPLHIADAQAMLRIAEDERAIAAAVDSADGS